MSLVLEAQNQISKSADTRANYKDLSALSSDLTLGLCKYGVTLHWEATSSDVSSPDRVMRITRM